MFRIIELDDEFKRNRKKKITNEKRETKYNNLKIDKESSSIFFFIFLLEIICPAESNDRNEIY